MLRGSSSSSSGASWMMAGAKGSKVLLVGGRGKERKVGNMLDRLCSPALERRW